MGRFQPTQKLAGLFVLGLEGIPAQLAISAKLATLRADGFFYAFSKQIK